MKILKYKKLRGNLYKIITDKAEYKLFDDIIIKYGLLLKKDITEDELNKILGENNYFLAYDIGLRAISVKLRTEKELTSILKKKGFNGKEINYAIDRLNKGGYLNHKVYIEAYIHDMLNLYIVGEDKIYHDLIDLGFKDKEITPFLEKINKDIYIDKINKYINKKLKGNKNSAKEFKRKTLNELINKGFKKGDILSCLDNIEIQDNEEIINRLVNKLYKKYIIKYDSYTTKLKIKNYLYQKGYNNIDIDKYLDN